MKPLNMLLIIIKCIFGGLVVGWWLLYIIASLIAWVLERFSFQFNSFSLAVIITMLFYIFIIVIYTMLEEKDTYYQESIKDLNIKLIRETSKSQLALTKEKEAYDIKVSEYDFQYKRARQELENQYLLKAKELENKEKEINTLEAYINNVINETSQLYPWLANIYSELFYSVDENLAKELRRKKRPAKKAADSISILAKEKKELIAQNKMLEHQLRYLEAIFPWLEEFEDANPYDIYNCISMSDSQDIYSDEYKSVLKNWLSPDEYNRLDNSEKYQLALDRYKNRKKTDWEVGIEFERYIGYLYESKGYKVIYHGAIMGLEDMGRDLIVKMPNEVLIIQCKRWAKTKKIHEKHIFQLYGSVVIETIKNPDRKYQGVFITTTSLSELALKCAETLNIDVKEYVDVEDYPLIKCNISKTGEKIYHLPFDQQYDRVDISPKKGEFYAYTIKEAEAKGFRRAFRWTMDK